MEVELARLLHDIQIIHWTSHLRILIHKPSAICSFLRFIRAWFCQWKKILFLCAKIWSRYRNVRLCMLCVWNLRQNIVCLSSTVWVIWFTKFIISLIWSLECKITWTFKDVIDRSSLRSDTYISLLCVLRQLFPS